MAEYEKWQWQEPGTTWKGAGLYHITLTIPDRQPLLGTLVNTTEKGVFYSNTIVLSGITVLVKNAMGQVF